MRLALALALPILLLAACTNAGDRLPTGGDVLVEGPVLRIDVEPMFRDGDGLIWIRDADHGSLVVRVPARRHQMCRADYVVDVAGIAPGTMLQARGAVTDRGEVLVCGHDSHFLRSVEIL